MAGPGIPGAEATHVSRGRVVIAALVLLAGCGLGDKQHQADAIVDAADLAFDAGTATGTLSAAMRFERLPDGATVSLGGLGGDAAMTQVEQLFTLDTAIDLDGDRATLTVPGKDQPFAVFDGLAAFGRRWNAGERDARPWVRVDLFDLAEGDELDLTGGNDIPTFATVALNPVLLLDLVAGPLTGSVEKVGTEQIAGVDTTRYSANFDIDKALRDTREDRYPEDRREAVEELLDVFHVAGGIHEGDVWLDGDGRVRRFELRLKEEPVSRFEIEHRVVLEITEYGGEVDVAVPTPREIVDIRSVVQLIRATVPTPNTPEFGAFLGVTPA